MSAAALRDRTAVKGRIVRFADVDQRTVQCIVSTQDAGRDGLVVLTAGIGLDNFRKNPVVLAAHDAARPVGRCINISAVGTELHGTVQFPPPGTSADSDQTLALIRANILNGISIGFRPLQTKPDINGGLQITQSELLEFSIVSIPALANALITSRSFRPTGDRSTVAGRRAHAARYWEHCAGDLPAKYLRTVALRRLHARILAEKYARTR